MQEHVADIAPVERRIDRQIMPATAWQPSGAECQEIDQHEADEVERNGRQHDEKLA